MNADQLKRIWMQYTGELKWLWDKFADNEPKMPSWRSERTTTNVSVDGSAQSKNEMPIKSAS
jgi:hypothetical protein